MCNEIDGCGPSVAIALPALVPFLHVECLVGNRAVMLSLFRSLSVHIIIMMTCCVMDLPIQTSVYVHRQMDRKKETVLLFKVCLYIDTLSLLQIYIYIFLNDIMGFMLALPVTAWR